MGIRASRTNECLFFAAAILFVAFLATLGCGRQKLDHAEDSASAHRATQMLPDDLLRSVFTRYRNAISYSDDARVRLRYQFGDNVKSEFAPLSVWLDRNRLDVTAYDVRLHQNHNVLTAWFTDPATNHFDSQVRQVTASHSRPNLKSILADAVLAGRLQAGLAGPPPQLEWLLADEPMKNLFDPEHTVQYARNETVEGRQCHLVRVEAKGDRYQFWIDQSEGIIRRVEFPIVDLPVDSSDSSQMRLTLELTGATFGTPSENFAKPILPRRPRFVHQFVPLPPMEPSRLLGSRPSEVRLSDQSGRIVLDVDRRDPPIRILGRFSGDERSVAAAAMLQNWNARLPQDIAGRCETIVVVDESAINAVPAALKLPSAIDRNDAALNKFALPPGGLTILDSRGRIAWLQPSVTPEALVAAGTILGDLVKGIDVPSRLHEQWQQDVQAYQRAVKDVQIENPVAL